ncbi:hypothetical protein JQ824_12250 [Brachyspira hyodysenteriae]|uniref:Uncharacterized protein n=4 Tax=Brachyspira hyodysenteriae TaxID=159 RepID=A0A3B6VG82_BRAHW|nr:hypothetical protein [Brachyspira hyodysenteriae]ACN83974.1 hypothetical protein BHWA1_01504 [Brachyspira hyodysenteriae WA1]KLI16155.1 hypothetical protein SU44_06740 [Brachyspira hyodysenteriae]KLI16238.1 hypothetical protein SU45_08185 [Brachyspira hyodysenteriae]KLI31378.1 hypothetical protein SZ49_03790 [Brachyspira hyodysenteriae]KLI33582.1 hypothetical protein SZ48_08505 [Brachyspira hyodysenteriae]
MKIKKKKNESNHNVIGLIIYLFLSLIIPSTAISFFAMADKNIKEKKEIIYNDKEIIDNNKQTNAANFDKEEILQKIITSLLLKGSSSSKYSGSKVDLKILGIRVLIVYGLTYILSLAITAIIAQKYYHEDIKIKEDIKETIETILVGLATLALMAFVLIVTVINMESNREYLAFSGVIFGFIACIIIRKIT